MLNINEINNQTILNTSLNSLFNNLKATGDLKVYDLYLLNLIFGKYAYYFYYLTRKIVQ